MEGRILHGAVAAMVLTYAGRVRRWWGLIPYVIVGVVHLGALATGAHWLSAPTKVLLMPALILALLVSVPSRRTSIPVIATIALLFSWAGDALLSSPGGVGFIIGLGCFTLAHATYIVLFLGPLKQRAIRRIAVLYLPWWIALVSVLAPFAGGLLVPLATYGLVLGVAAATALGSSRLVAVGALLFLLSDSLLALKLFYPGFRIWQQDALIMLGYLTGQGLIIVGTVLIARRARPGTRTHRTRSARSSPMTPAVPGACTMSAPGAEPTL